ncbi:uncharacterized protein LOC144384559 [Gasterosteus aculeatus]
MAESNSIINGPQDGLDGHTSTLMASNFQKAVMEELTTAREKIAVLTDRVIELEDLEKKSNLQISTLKDAIREGVEIIVHLQEVEADQKNQITQLCKEKEARQGERKLTEETCLMLKTNQGAYKKIKRREFKPGEISKKVKEWRDTEKAFNSSEDFRKERSVDQEVREEGSLAAASPYMSSPCLPSVSLQDKEMNSARQTTETQRQNFCSVKKSLRDLQQMARNHVVGMAVAHQTINTQELENSSLQQCLPDLLKKVEDHEAEMTQAHQTIKTQGKEISNLKERLQDLHTVNRYQAVEIQKLSEEKLIFSRKSRLLESAIVDLEKCLLESRSVLTDKTTELIQIQNCKRDDLTLRREYETERMKREQLEEDKQILEDICFLMKKRTLGFFGRRMEDRGTELAKMRTKMLASYAANGYLGRPRHMNTRVLEADVAAQSSAGPSGTAG